MTLKDWLALIVVGVPLALCMWSLALTSLVVLWRFLHDDFPGGKGK